MAAALPDLSVSGVGKLTSQSFDKVAGPDAWKYAISDDTPIMNAAFDWIGGLGTMLKEGLLGKKDIEDDPAAEQVKQLHDDEDDGTAGISNTLDDQTKIMQENLDVSKELLQETQGDRFAELEAAREAKRAAAAGTKAKKPDLINFPELPEGMSLLSWLGILTGVWGGIQAFLQGFVATMPSTWKALLEQANKFKTFLSKYNIKWASNLLAKSKKDLEIYKTLNNSFDMKALGIGKLERGLLTIRGHLKAGNVRFMELAFKLFSFINSIFRWTIFLPNTLITELEKIRGMSEQIPRQADRLRGAWRLFADTWFGKSGRPNDGVLGRIAQSFNVNTKATGDYSRAIMQIRRFGESMRTFVLAVAKPFEILGRFMRTIAKPFRGSMRVLGRIFGRFLAPVFMAIEAWKEFTKSGSIFNSIMAATKEFFILWIGSIADFLLIVVPGWIAEKVAGLFGFDDIAAKIHTFRKEFDLGEAAWEGLMLLQSSIWNAVMGMINAMIESINQYVPFIDHIDWRATYMDSKTGHLYKEGGGTYDTADEAYASRAGDYEWAQSLRLAPWAQELFVPEPEQLLNDTTLRRAQAAGHYDPAPETAAAPIVLAPTVNQGDTNVLGAPQTSTRAGQQGKQRHGNRMRARPGAGG